MVTCLQIWVVVEIEAHWSMIGEQRFLSPVMSQFGLSIVFVVLNYFCACGKYWTCVSHREVSVSNVYELSQRVGLHGGWLSFARSYMAWHVHIRLCKKQREREREIEEREQDKFLSAGGHLCENPTLRCACQRNSGIAVYLVVVDAV